MRFLVKEHDIVEFNKCKPFADFEFNECVLISSESLGKTVAKMFQLYNKCREKSADSKCNCCGKMN